MQDWKLPQLRSHKEFTLGRIDGLRWALAQPGLSEEQTLLLKGRLKTCEDTERQLDAAIEVIIQKREADKAKEKTRRAELHERLSGRSLR